MREGLLVRTALLAVAAGCGAIAAYRAIYWFKVLHAPVALLLLVLGLGAGFAFAALALRAQFATAKRVFYELGLLGAVLCVAELLIINASPQIWTSNIAARKQLVLQAAARRLGAHFDTRSISEVVEDLRSEGIDALPGVGRSWARHPQMEAKLRGEFYPLSHASGAHVVECNESGDYLIYETDEFGFNNPNSDLRTADVDVAVVGESHVLGHCVRVGRGFVDMMRAHTVRVANLGLANTHALSQLGTFREYVEPLQPPVVLWVVNPGLTVLKDEQSNPLLQRYLEPSFSQNLLARQPEVDRIVRTLSPAMQAETDRRLRQEMERAKRERFLRFYKLENVRSLFDLSAHRRQAEIFQPDTELFERALQLAQDAVAGWGGKLLVLILPEYGEAIGMPEESLRHDAVLQAARRLDLDVIDGAEAFLAHSDPESLYTFRMQNHPTEQGHALLAELVMTRLTSLFAFKATGDATSNEDDFDE